MMAVPKFHVLAHGPKCLYKFHPSSVKGAGKTDGEACERLWGYLGLFYAIALEMSSHNRTNMYEVTTNSPIFIY